MSETSPLLIERDAGVLTLSINDAPINRMSFDYMDALEDAVENAAKDPDVRVLLRVRMDDLVRADEIFTILMGEQVEPRRAFIEEHAMEVKNLDI